MSASGQTGVRRPSLKLSYSTVVQLLVLTAVTFTTYSHDLFGVARADQLVYFYRTAGINNFWSSTFGTLDFNRTHGIGDYVLFRPIFYFVLGVEKWLWGYRFLPWQATSLGLHVAVVLSLFAYFRGRLWAADGVAKDSWLPFVLSVFFATLYAGSEMVAWQHVAGYLLFCLLLVQSAIRYRSFAAQPSTGRAAGLIACATLAAFTYELGVAVLIAFAILCAMPNKRGKHDRRLFGYTAAILLVAVVVYGTADYLDYRGEGSKPISLPSIGHWAYVAGYAARWMTAMIVPSAMSLQPGSRITAYFNLLSADPASIIIAATLVLGCAAVLRLRRRPEDVRMALLFVGLDVVYTTMIVIDRAVPKGFEVTFWLNSYYLYTFALLLLLAAFHLTIVPAETPTGRAPGFARWAIVVALLQISALGAYKTYNLMRTERYGYAEPIERMVERIDELVRQHNAEQDFSFTVQPGCKGNPDQSWFSIQTTVHRSSYPIAWILYPEYERDAGGKYVIPCKN